MRFKLHIAFLDYLFEVKSYLLPDPTLAYSPLASA